MKKLNIIYHITVIVIIGYLGIANYLLTEKVRRNEYDVMASMMISNDISIKLEMFMQMMADGHKDEIRTVLEEILKEKTD